MKERNEREKERLGKRQDKMEKEEKIESGETFKGKGKKEKQI